jgi:hypothetical protein
VRTNHPKPVGACRVTSAGDSGEGVQQVAGGPRQPVKPRHGNLCKGKAVSDQGPNFLYQGFLDQGTTCNYLNFSKPLRLLEEPQHMPEAGPYIVLIAENDRNSYIFADDRETAESAFSNAKRNNKSAVAITFAKLTIIDSQVMADCTK